MRRAACRFHGRYTIFTALVMRSPIMHGRPFLFLFDAKMVACSFKESVGTCCQHRFLISLSLPRKYQRSLLDIFKNSQSCHMTQCKRSIRMSEGSQTTSGGFHRDFRVAQTAATRRDAQSPFFHDRAAASAPLPSARYPSFTAPSALGYKYPLPSFVPL